MCLVITRFTTGGTQSVAFRPDSLLRESLVMGSGCIGLLGEQSILRRCILWCEYLSWTACVTW